MHSKQSIIERAQEVRSTAKMPKDFWAKVEKHQNAGLSQVDAIQAANREPSGLQSIASPSASAQSTATAPNAYWAQVDKHQQAGLTRSQAMKSVNKQHPELRKLA